MCLGFFHSTTIDVLTMFLVAEMYSSMSSFLFGGTNTGGEARYSLSFWKASSASIVHSNLLVFLSSLKKGIPFSPSQDMNLFSAVIQPVNF